MDLDAIFARHLVGGIKDTSYNRKALKEIDECEYESATLVKTKFGNSISVLDLSTGCKAALLAGNIDLELNLSECGSNARDFIIRNAKDAKLVIDFRGTDVSFELDDDSLDAYDIPLDIIIDGVEVHSIEDLNFHLAGLDEEW